MLGEINMKKKFLIFFGTMLILIYVCICFQNSYAEQENIDIIYSYSTINKTIEEVNKEWISNDDRYWLLKGKIDDQSEINYFAWTNVNREHFKENTGLDLGTKLEIEIKQQDIPLNQYDDIRLKFNYIISNGDLNILDLNSMGIYILAKNINTNEQKWYGPYKLQEYSFVTILNRVQNEKNILEEEYECVSENLTQLISKENSITKIKIIPYDDIEYDMETKNCYMGLFRMNSFEVIGYKNGTKFEEQQKKKISIDEEDLRRKIANNMYKLATVKWIPSENIVTEVPAYVGTNSNPNYEKDKTYYGLPYASNIDTTLEAFVTQLNNGIYVGPITLDEVYAVECCSSIWAGISRYIPLVAGKLNYGPRKFFTHTEIQMLGGLTYNENNKFSTEAIKENYTEQEIYNAYAQLKIGDMVFTNPIGTHVRIVTGNTIVKYNENNEIIPEESYVITSEISGRDPNVEYDLEIENVADEMDETLSEYTDLQTVQELKGKYTQWKINKKYTFSELYNNKLAGSTQMYIPVTLKSYNLGKVDEPNVILVNGNTNDNILNGLKGSIYSNYAIKSINYYIVNKTKNIEKNMKIYPNSTNTFSLYYETTDEIQNLIKDIKDSEYEIIISVTAGEKENIILQLNNKKQEFSFNNLKITQFNEKKLLTNIDIKNNTASQIINSEKEALGNTYTLKFYKGDTEITGDTRVCTGNIVKVMNGDIVEQEFIVIIYGDVTGNGNPSAVDALAIVKNKLGTAKFSDEVLEEAGRISEITRKTRGTPSSVDALAIVKYKLGIGTIIQYYTQEQDNIEND